MPVDPSAPYTLEEQAAEYFWYAERFGWTPDQVDALPAWIDSRVHTVAAAYDDLRRQMQEEQG